MIVAGAVLFVGMPSLFTRDLWLPDEPRYVEVAREMVVLGDYLVPHLNGEVYSEKPPLFFWISGLLWKAGAGFSAGRLVTVLSVMATLALVFLVAGKADGMLRGILAAGASLSTLLLLSFVRIGNLDALLMFFVTSSILAGYCALSRQVRFPDVYWLLCYGCMGLGVLTKGPVGLLLPALVLCSYAGLNRKCIRAGGWVHVRGAAVLIAIVAAWLGPAIAVGGSEYAGAILFGQNIGRAVASFSHREPIYWYLVWAPVCFFPWTFILPVCVAAAIRQWRRTQESLPVLAVVWLVVPLVFLSLVSGKRANYIVPVVPAVGILSGWYLGSAARGQGNFAAATGWLLKVAFGILIVLTVGLAAALVVVAFLPNLPEGFTGRPKDFLESLAQWLSGGRLVAAVVMLMVPLGVCVARVALGLRQGPAAGLALAAAVLLLGLPQDLIITPALNPLQSARSFACAVQRHVKGARQVYVFGSDYAGVYNLYLGMVRMPVIRTRARLGVLVREPEVLVIADARDATAALTPEDFARCLRHSEQVGGRQMVLLAGPVRHAGTVRGPAGRSPAAASDDRE